MGFFEKLIPYRKQYYLLNLDEKTFLDKLEKMREELEKTYIPGKHYLIHQPDGKYFLYKNKKINPGNNSGGEFLFRYFSSKDKVYVLQQMKYSFVVNFFIVLLTIIPMTLLLGFSFFTPSNIVYLPIPLGLYLVFNFVFQLEVWIVQDLFKDSFAENIVAETTEQEVKI